MTSPHTGFCVQDGQEFFKLLLSHLEAKLKRSSSKVPSLEDHKNH